MKKKLKVCLSIVFSIFMLMSPLVINFMFGNNSITTVSIESQQDTTNEKTDEEKQTSTLSEITEKKWIENCASSFSAGTGSENDPYQISSAEEFAYLASQSNKENKSQFTYNKHFVLTNDIVLNDGFFDEDGAYTDGGDGVLYTWETVYLNYGNFDGQNHTIYGLYFDNQEVDNVALFFGSTRSLKNFNIENVYINANKYASSVMIVNSVVIANNIHASKGYINGRGQMISGLFADTTAHFDNKIYDCSNSLDVAQKQNVSTTYRISGICSDVVVAENCVNTGKLTSINSQYVGGICGVLTPNGVVSGCENYGEVDTSSTTYSIGIGGIVGRGDNNISIVETKNFADLEFKAQKGTGAAILGRMNGAYVKFLNCENYGNLIGFYVLLGVGGPVEVLSFKNYGNLTNSSFIGRADNVIIKNTKLYGDMFIESQTQHGIFAQTMILGDLTIVNSGFYGNITKETSGDLFYRFGLVGYGNDSNYSLFAINVEIKTEIDVPGGDLNLVGDVRNACLKNCIFDLKIVDTTQDKIALLPSVQKNENFTLENIYLKVFSNRSVSTQIVRESVADLVSIKFKNILIEESINNIIETPTWFKQENVCQRFETVQNLIRKTKTNNEKYFYHYGNDFSEFYVDFKTGKLGLKSFLGKGFYQGKITETWLLSHGYEKKTG